MLEFNSCKHTDPDLHPSSHLHHSCQEQELVTTHKQWKLFRAWSIYHLHSVKTLIWKGPVYLVSFHSVLHWGIQGLHKQYFPLWNKGVTFLHAIRCTHFRQNHPFTLSARFPWLYFKVFSITYDRIIHGKNTTERKQRKCLSKGGTIVPHCKLRQPSMITNSFMNKQSNQPWTTKGVDSDAQGSIHHPDTGLSLQALLCWPVIPDWPYLDPDSLHLILVPRSRPLCTIFFVPWLNILERKRGTIIQPSLKL